MCLGTPARILAIDGQFAEAEIGGIKIRTALHLVEDIQVGDYVLIHTGFAIEKLTPQEADENIRLLREIEDTEADQSINGLT